LPRFTGQEARWETFRRWLILRLEMLKGDEFLVVEAPGVGYVQFLNEGSNLVGECSDRDAYSDALREQIRQVGWGPVEEDSNSPNFRAIWFPLYVPVPTPESPWTPDLEDAVDAADLALRTLREIFGITDPGHVELNGGRTITVNALDAELGTLFSSDGD
jgi:hypothetical protein